jgi:hypothetical protein
MAQDLPDNEVVNNILQVIDLISKANWYLCNLILMDNVKPTIQSVYQKRSFIMKKIGFIPAILAAILALAMVFALVSCPSPADGISGEGGGPARGPGQPMPHSSS